MEKSANKRWKESRSTLTFKEWIDRENKKNESVESTFIPFDGIPALDTSSINTTIEKAQQDILVASGYKDKPSNTTIFGLDKNILIFSTLLIVGSVGFYFYKKSMKK
jgi:hypothetical protein